MDVQSFKAIYPNLNLIASADSFFGTVKNQFSEYKKSGFFRSTEESCIFIYELSRGVKYTYGVITSTDISNFNNGKVLKHENTIAVKEQKMMNIMLQNSAMVKPVLLAYDPVKEINTFIKKEIKDNEPFMDLFFEVAQERHRIYKITHPDRVQTIINLFKTRVPRSYIADGHHRVKTCQLLNQTSKENVAKDTSVNSILCTYMAWDQLSIYDYNRCIDAFANFSPLKFMGKLSEYCKITPINSGKKPQRKHEMTMFLYGEWYRLKWRKKILKKHKNELVLFDTFLLNYYVLNNILGVVDVREDIRLRYLDGVVGTDGMEQMVNENQNRVGFCMYPITSENIKAISEAGLTLPPKSTWFEPRVKNGIVAKKF